MYDYVWRRRFLSSVQVCSSLRWLFMSWLNTQRTATPIAASLSISASLIFMWLLHHPKWAVALCAALSGTVDAAYQQGADFLRKRVGLENPAVIARTLDVAMNPNSLFVSFRDKKRSKNANVRFS